VSLKETYYKNIKKNLTDSTLMNTSVACCVKICCECVDLYFISVFENCLSHISVAVLLYKKKHI